ncbi:DEAD/DEAH box helicase [Candidatus Woesearchaeota archaeon]|nr:DEAD/DEAH box helicase [Candidatus Woesearchaeota archaeon]
MLKNFTPRLYQETIFATTTAKNTLVVLPTGMGKTNICLMLAAHRLHLYPQLKILILAPTKPLVEQIMNVFKNHLVIEPEKITMFTGFVSPEKRQELWKTATVIVSTPQGLENDIIGSKISLEDVSLLVIDEAHRASGDYSYVWVAKQYEKTAKYPRILALTASPGSELEKIDEILKNLFIEEIEVRVDTDPDVAPYVQEVDVRYIKVELSEELKAVQKYLHECLQTKEAQLKQLNLEQPNVNFNNKTDILRFQRYLQGELASGNRDFDIMKALSLAAEAIKVQHALELVETQGITALHQYMDDIMLQAKTSKVKAVQNLSQDLHFKSAYVKTKSLFRDNVEHPKFLALQEHLAKLPKEYKLIIFTQFRDSAAKILDEINKLDNIKARLFIGQANKRQKGMSQKKQIELLQQFREDQFNTLVSSSIGEEGLDIPQVDEVIFYEPIPSAIRQIQRRGRTGRSDKGKVTILMTMNTRDEGYKWSSYHKEKRMYRTLKELKARIALIKREKIIPAEIKSMNVNLHNYMADNHNSSSSSLHAVERIENLENNNLQDIDAAEKKIKLYVDYREKGNLIIKELLENNVEINLDRLESADYLLSKDVAIEFKTQEDFIDSLLDGRIFLQIKELKQNFQKPVLLVEGGNDLFSIRNVHPNAIRGLLATIAVSFSLPILFTKNHKESAAMILIIAKREQDLDKTDFSLHGSKKPMSIKELQEYIVSSFPGVGAGLAKPLLREFKTIKKIVNASEDELRKVELVGEKKAKKIKDIFEREWMEL